MPNHTQSYHSRKSERHLTSLKAGCGEFSTPTKVKMRNLVSVKAKANAYYRCQECGSTELIQAHHEIPGDDNSLVVLCAECHSRKHPNLPKALFFNKGIQPYWHNKSASSLAKELGVHPRTVIRAVKRLEILPGELSSREEKLIKHNVRRIPAGCVTASQARKRLGLSRSQLNLRISREVLPAPTFIDRDTGVRYFDESWLRIARAIMANSFEVARLKNEKATR